MPEVLHGLGLDRRSRSRAPASWSATAGGRRLCSPAAGLAPLVARDTDRNWEPRPGLGRCAWRALNGWPLWLRQPGNKFWFAYLAPARALYVQFNEVGDKPDQTVAQFADSLFAFARVRPVDRLVLDLRLNGGGNGGLNRPLVLGLIRADALRGRGHLFVLIGRRNLLRGAVPRERHRALDRRDLRRRADRVARQSTNGDSYRIRLPNSGVTVACLHPLLAVSDPRDLRPWTPPEVATELTFDDYRRNRRSGARDGARLGARVRPCRADARRARPRRPFRHGFRVPRLPGRSALPLCEHRGPAQHAGVRAPPGGAARRTPWTCSR